VAYSKFANKPAAPLVSLTRTGLLCKDLDNRISSISSAIWPLSPTQLGADFLCLRKQRQTAAADPMPQINSKPNFNGANHLSLPWASCSPLAGFADASGVTAAAGSEVLAATTHPAERHTQRGSRGTQTHGADASGHMQPPPGTHWLSRGQLVCPAHTQLDGSRGTATPSLPAPRHH
jgi:hypothetical protein